MSSNPTPQSDLVMTVKSREVQPAVLAEMANDRTAAVRHFLAAAHLELVLAEDYAEVGAADLALRSRFSAASCFWRGGQRAQARSLFETILRTHPCQTAEVERLVAELIQDYAAQTS